LDILQFKKANCKNCFKCLRECAVKAIAIKNEQAEIIKDDCLLCGHCLTVCPQNAKEARIDTQQVRQMIKSGKKVIASVAPSFIAGFDVTDLHEFEQKLIHLGFSAATETSCGAKVVANEYQRILSEGKFPNMVSSSCPTIIKLMEKYYPQVLKYLAPVLSPMTAHNTVTISMLFL
jgi:iron only hydrogenase large subunit-like protein